MKDSQPTQKIGILSMQRVPNYGSFLQAFALLQVIKKLRPNADVLFVDIKPDVLFRERLVVFLRMIGGFILKGSVFKVVQRCLYIAKQRQLVFKKYQRKYLNLTDKHNYGDTLNSIVIGSDEVFNCLQRASWGFSKNLLGEGLNTNNVITYAASCGATTIAGVEAMSLSKEVEKAFKNIKQFSVRDENTFQFVKRFAGKEACTSVDPVFLFNFDTYIPAMRMQNQDYVLVYSYTERFSIPDEISAIRKFAKENNMKIIGTFGYQSWCDKNLILDPFELLAYVKQASYIVTDTFHGTIFSIKYNKPFVSFVRHNRNNAKLHHLLKIFELQDREINNINDLQEKLKQKINYGSVNRIIDRQTQISFDYLDQYL